MQLFMPYYNLEYTKALTYTMANVAGGIGQGPATEVTHLGLNQLPVFSSILLCLSILDLRSVWQCMHAPSCPDRGTQVHQIEDVEGDVWGLKGPMAKVDWGSRATDCLIGC